MSNEVSRASILVSLAADYLHHALNDQLDQIPAVADDIVALLGDDVSVDAEDWKEKK